MEKYQGHKNWNFWNVALWLHNDQGLYFTMLDARKQHSRKIDAARKLKALLPECTPDGAKYTIENICAAIPNMNEI